MTAVLVAGRSARGAVDLVSSRVPARRPGNFHLLAQMKVTKAKGLNTTPNSILLRRSGGAVRRALA